MMAETETWKRGRPSQGLRQINIRYEIAEPAWRDIEDYCERIPYKHVNQGMLNALLMGSRVLLESTTSGQPSVPAQLSNTDASPSPGRPPAASHTVAAGQSASWVRARQTAGPRTFNIRYKVDEAEWSPIEALLERAPYKKVNHIMRYALLVGAGLLLRTSPPGQIIAQARPSTIDYKPAPQPVVATVPAPPPPAAAPAYSSAAAGMFESFGGKKGET